MLLLCYLFEKKSSKKEPIDNARTRRINLYIVSHALSVLLLFSGFSHVMQFRIGQFYGKRPFALPFLYHSHFFNSPCNTRALGIICNFRFFHFF